jgi:hypothetical protein
MMARPTVLGSGSSYPDHRDVRSSALLRRFRAECLLFHSDDHVIPFLPGVYVNLDKRWHTTRTITGPYLQMVYWDFRAATGVRPGACTKR